MKIIYYKNGNEQNLDTSKLDTKEILIKLKELSENTTQIMRVYISEERLEAIKKEETGLEFILGKEIIINSPVLGKYSVKKIFIPLSGDFIGNEKSPVITVFLGKDEYYPEALRNMNGYNDLKYLENKLVGNR